MAKKQAPLPAKKSPTVERPIGATNFARVPGLPQTGSQSLLPDSGNVHPEFRAPLPTGPPRPQTGSTSITPAQAPKQTGAAYLYAAPRQFGPERYVGLPNDPAKPGVPLVDDCLQKPFAPMSSLVRDRNGAAGPDDLIGGNRGRDGGGRVDAPFTPEWDKPKS
jgi:hypothetical protein